VKKNPCSDWSWDRPKKYFLERRSGEVTFLERNNVSSIWKAKIETPVCGRKWRLHILLRPEEPQKTCLRGKGA